MDPWKYHRVTCADLVHLNPIHDASFDELVDLLDVPAGGRVLDVACGKAECLIRVASRYSISGVGVDLCPDFLEAARQRARECVPATSSLSFVEQDGANFTAADGSFDLAILLGASWVFGGYQGALRRLAALVRPGGQVMVGEPFWAREPHPDYLTATDTPKAEFQTHAENAAVPPLACGTAVCIGKPGRPRRGEDS